MQNLGGALVVLVGAFFLVVGLKGTQHAALPSLFPAAAQPPAGTVQIGPITIGPSQPGTPSSGNPVTGSSGNYD